MIIESHEFEEAVTKLRKLTSLLSSDSDLKKIVDSKEEVLCRFQPIFRPDHIPGRIRSKCPGADNCEGCQ